MKDKLIQAFSNLMDSIIAAVPKIAMGLLLIAAALLVAKIIEKVLRYALTKIRFDALVGKAGIDVALQRIGIRQELTIQLPRLVYFLVLLLFAKTAVDALGLVAISGAIGAFFGYLAEYNCGAGSVDSRQHSGAVCRADRCTVGGKFRSRVRSRAWKAGFRRHPVRLRHDGHRPVED